MFLLSAVGGSMLGCVVVGTDKGGMVEKPKDIDGVVYVEMDERKAWQMEVVKDMKECGYKVGINKL